MTSYFLEVPFLINLFKSIALGNLSGGGLFMEQSGVFNQGV